MENEGEPRIPCLKSNQQTKNKRKRKNSHERKNIVNLSKEMKTERKKHKQKQEFTQDPDYFDPDNSYPGEEKKHLSKTIRCNWN